MRDRHAHADGERRLRIEVHEQHTPTEPVDTDAKVEGRGGLADAALLVDDGGDGRPALLGVVELVRRSRAETEPSGMR